MSESVRISRLLGEDGFTDLLIRLPDAFFRMSKEQQEDGWRQMRRSLLGKHIQLYGAKTFIPELVLVAEEFTKSEGS